MLGVAPQTWQAMREFKLAPLDESMLRQAVTGCWFPVHAMGYNWLRSNKKSGKEIAARIEALIKRYVDQGYQCEKVIVVTHSMGGLVARALIHPDMGNLKEKCWAWCMASCQPLVPAPVTSACAVVSRAG